MDAVKTAISSIAYKDDIPQYELAGTELIFPLNVEQDGDEFRALFRMSPPARSYEIKEFFDDLIARRKAAEGGGGEVEVQVADDARCRAFIDKHFLGLMGAEGDPSAEAQRKFLDDNPHLKMRIFREGYDSVRGYAEQGAAPRKGLRIGPAASPENVVQAKMTLYCPVRGSEQVIILGHHLRRETELDRRKHQKAFQFIEKRDVSLVRCNWDVIEQMYDEMVLTLNGYLIDGAACGKDNREEWVRLVPFTHKVFVLNKVFAQARVKN